LTKNSQSQIIKPKKRSRFAFFGDVIAELRKVTWPSRRDTVRLTAMVLGVCIAVGLFLGALDYGFAELVARVFLRG
jgi:preprotein translocase subunit SecE